MAPPPTSLKSTNPKVSDSELAVNESALRQADLSRLAGSWLNLAAFGYSDDDNKNEFDKERGSSTKEISIATEEGDTYVVDMNMLLRSRTDMTCYYCSEVL